MVATAKQITRDKAGRKVLYFDVPGDNVGLFEATHVLRLDNTGIDDACFPWIV